MLRVQVPSGALSRSHYRSRIKKWKPAVIKKNYGGTFWMGKLAAIQGVLKTLYEVLNLGASSSLAPSANK